MWPRLMAGWHREDLDTAHFVVKKSIISVSSFGNSPKTIFTTTCNRKKQLTLWFKRAIA